MTAARAGAWQGYTESARAIMRASRAIRDGVRAVPGIRLMGLPPRPAALPCVRSMCGG